MKNTVMKAIVLLLLFAIVVSGSIYFAIQHYQKTHHKAEDTNSALPVVILDHQYGSGFLYGHTKGAGDELPPLGYLADQVFCLNSEDVLTGKIVFPGQNDWGRECTYRIRSMGDHNLIDEGTLKPALSSSQKDAGFVTLGSDRYGDTATFSIKASSLLKERTEYLLTIDIGSESKTAVYVCRIILLREHLIGELTDFTLKFSSATFDKSAASELLPYYIKSQDSRTEEELEAAINDYGYGVATLYSSYSLLTWGDLDISERTAPMIRYSELSPDQISVELAYHFRLGGGKRICRVSENFCVRKRNDRIYLLDYYREVQEIWNPEKALTSGGNVNFGISASRDAEFKSSPNGVYTVFERDGQLWSFDASLNRMSLIYSWYEGDSNPVTEAERNVCDRDYPGHAFHITKVDDEGNIEFLLYGYMPSGKHAGENGMILYQYENGVEGKKTEKGKTDSGKSDGNNGNGKQGSTARQATLTELLYAPSNFPLELAKERNALAVSVNEKNLCYLLYGSRIYAIVLDDDVMYQVTDSLQYGKSAVAENDEYVAWERQSDQEGFSEMISIMNLKTGAICEIIAREGEYLQTIGFIGNDLVYGVGDRNDRYSSVGGEKVYPLKRLVIVDGDSREVMGSYEKEEYVVGYHVYSGRITLDLQKKTGTGKGASAWEDAGEDVILLNAGAKDAEEEALSRTELARRVENESDSNEVVFYLDLGASVNRELPYVVKNTKEQVRETMNRLPILAKPDLDQFYLVRARGRVTSVSRELYESVRDASSAFGKVRDVEGRCYFALSSKAEEVKLELSASPDKEASSLGNGIAVMTCYQMSPSEIDTAIASGKDITEVVGGDGSRILNLTGHEAGVLMYYLDQGQPCILVTKNKTCKVLMGYDKENNAILYDPLKGREEKENFSDLTERCIKDSVSVYTMVTWNDVKC